MTRQRKLILQELHETESHPTADEIYERVRRKLPRISLGTVYRNLQTLAEDGAIRTFSDGSRTRYDGTLHDHHHVRCLSCGRVGDVPVGAAPRCPDQNNDSNGKYRIIGYKIDFVGICPDCERQGKEVVSGEKNLNDYRLV
jgi:Fur family ferric uptake transcriptional regulator